MIYKNARTSPNANILKTVPRIMDFTALMIASEIDNVERFSDPEKLKLYTELAPSISNSANIVHRDYVYVLARGSADVSRSKR